MPAHFEYAARDFRREGGGLGDLGIRYGYQRFMPEVMALVVIVLIVIVQAVQSLAFAAS